MRKIFLACPYSHAEATVVHERFIQCNRVAAQIIEAGHAVFSQVSMSHPINLAFVGKDSQAIGKLWAPVDALFMEMMGELIVLDLPGWELSSGIQREIEFFRQRGRLVSLWSEVSVEFA
ncbi:DUF1937 domain-containing protein [Pseudomonas gingeri NCPPB 3146 = LMG 5327]|uniref:DUF1937 family protein n=2 Tax=Pseudomonas gingeri TaxID=117681 RepID=A0A7Y7XXL2_9PSED|nr:MULTISPECIES: DUF1937 family protein [Pseudomonas]NWC13861.1 DUF1937 family protein [Pseudomonas gingeri]NWE48196.1 DUF1937 family protein [Pseudomonas gingeri]PNQ93969.1 DUF1937 domain-containing protein [Pseudomonas gingeri NCPPB 3146 = LMG 5327]BBP76770.1 hypothetical protein PHLH7_28740 [Pseudomonas sp. Ost2]